MRMCSVVSDSVTPWTAAHQAPLSISQARILKCVAISSFRASSQLRDLTYVSFRLKCVVCLSSFWTQMSHEGRRSRSPGKSIDPVSQEE